MKATGTVIDKSFRDLGPRLTHIAVEDRAFPDRPNGRLHEDDVIRNRVEESGTFVQCAL